MPIHTCPHCRDPRPTHLLEVSLSSQVNYYRCEGCGAVWNLPKNRPDAEPYMVTTPSAPQIKSHH